MHSPFELIPIIILMLLMLGIGIYLGVYGIVFLSKHDPKWVHDWVDRCYKSSKKW